MTKFKNSLSPNLVFYYKDNSDTAKAQCYDWMIETEDKAIIDFCTKSDMFEIVQETPKKA